MPIGPPGWWPERYEARKRVDRRSIIQITTGSAVSDGPRSFHYGASNSEGYAMNAYAEQGDNGTFELFRVHIKGDLAPGQSPQPQHFGTATSVDEAERKLHAEVAGLAQVHADQAHLTCQDLTELARAS